MMSLNTYMTGSRREFSTIQPFESVSNQVEKNLLRFQTDIVWLTYCCHISKVQFGISSKNVNK